MEFYEIKICQVMIFRLYAVYNKHEMVKIGNQTSENSKALSQELEQFSCRLYMAMVIVSELGQTASVVLKLSSKFILISFQLRILVFLHAFLPPQSSGFLRKLFTAAMDIPIFPAILKPTIPASFKVNILICSPSDNFFPLGIVLNTPNTK